MATVAGAYAWPASPPLRPSPIPDTSSPIYPGRPIRPMPKRRIRDRLSAEHAATIDYPPQPPSSSPIFGYPYVQGEGEVQRRGLRAGSHEQVPCADCGHEHSELESEEEEEDDRHPTMQFSPDSLQITRRDGDYYGNGKLATRAEREAKTLLAGSQASSADGYESFENMSNKKKRKIPQSGIGGHGHHNSLSADMANITISQRDGTGSEPDDGTGYSGTSYGYAHNSPGNTAAGLSGPGRGRYGRSGRGSLDRRPLGASTNGLNAPVSHKGPKQSYGKTAPVPGEPGIISAAMANAAQNMPARPNTKGQENVSMLQQHASKSPPQKTDFTFTPEGGENRPVWPGGQAPSGPSAYPHPPPPGVKGARRPQGTQTSPNPNMNGVPPPPAPGSYPQGHHAPQPAPTGPATAGATNPAPPPKPRKPRNRARTFEIAARQRKLQKEYQNYQNPPKREDIWICEFCEYEAIFGKPPFALIWDYEKKDQAERKRLAERRRLLEKAKMKGRKGKKGSKKNANHNNANNTNVNTNAGQAPPPNQQYDDDGAEEEYYEGEYQYDDEGLDPLPPMPHNTPGSYPLDPPHPHPHTNGGAYPDDAMYAKQAHAAPPQGLATQYTPEMHAQRAAGVKPVEQKYARKPAA